MYGILIILTLEQMVGKLLADHVVHLLPGLGGEPHQKPVQLARHIHQLRVEEGWGERDWGDCLPLQNLLLNQAEMN